jgi:hypothetical protein
MIKKIIFGFLIILWWQSALATDIICVAGKEFVVHNLVRRAQASATFKVTLNVVDFKAREIKIFETDSYKPVDIYEESTIENIKRMVFLVDTANFTFFIKYIILPSRYLSRDCAIVNSNNEVCLYFSSEEYGLLGHLRINYSLDPRLPYLISYIPYEIGMHRPSDIFVKRVFNGNQDTTIILKNNNPDYTSTVLEIARSYSRKDFLKFFPEYESYFIKYYIRRNIPSCGCDEIY